MIPKGVLGHAEIRRDTNKRIMSSLRFGYSWPNTMALLLWKKSIFGRNTNILLTLSFRKSVFEEVPWDTFKASQGTGDKEIAHKRWGDGES